MSSSLTRFRFPFQFRLQHLSRFDSRYSCNSANLNHIDDCIDERQLFLNYVREQCDLGFTNLYFPSSLFHRMMSYIHRPSIIDFTRLFSAMLKLKRKRFQPHPTIISFYKELEFSGTRPDLYSISILANCYCQLGRVGYGFSLLGKSLKLGYPFESDLVLFNTLINGLVRTKRIPQAFKLLDVVVFNLGIEPDLNTYGTMVKGLCRVGDIDGAFKLLHRMNCGVSGLKPNRVIYTILIHSLCKEESWVDALKLFYFMKTEGVKPDAFTYTSLIRGLFDLGCKDEAKRLLAEMLESDVSPDVIAYNVLVEMHVKNGVVDEAESILKKMVERGVSPNLVTYSALMDGYCCCGEMDRARDLMDLIIKTTGHPNVAIYNTLINGYVKHRIIDKALDTFHELLENGVSPDVVTYNTLIDGLCKSGKLKMARQLFNDMEESRVKPDVWTYGVLLTGLCKDGQLDEAVALLTQMESNGVTPNIFIYNILIHSFCETGKVKVVVNLVSDLRSRGLEPDDVTFNTMINGFCKKGLMTKAIELLDEVERIGCPPNRAAYNTLIRWFITNDDLLVTVPSCLNKFVSGRNIDYFLGNNSDVFQVPYFHGSDKMLHYEFGRRASDNAIFWTGGFLRSRVSLSRETYNWRTRTKKRATDLESQAMINDR